MIPVRFYCRILPTDEPQLGAEYLLSVRDAGFQVRACPIGPMYLDEGPWPELNPLFSGETPGKPFWNLVCAPPGLEFGRTLTRGDYDGRFGEGRDDVIYRPQTALATLWTEGVKNIALMVAYPGLTIDSEEVKAIRRYDWVFTPDRASSEILSDFGFSVKIVPATSVAITNALM